MKKIDQLPNPGAGSLHSGTQALPPRRIRVIGVPLDMGASRRGVDMGPSAMRVAGLEARLEALGHRVTDGGNIRVEIAETQAFGERQCPLSEADRRDLHPHRRCRRQDARRGHDPAGAGRRPLPRRRLRLRSRRVLPPPGTEDRRALDRRPLRHQHAGDLALRQRARHAAGRAAGPGPGSRSAISTATRPRSPRRTRC